MHVLLLADHPPYTAVLDRLGFALSTTGDDYETVATARFAVIDAATPPDRIAQLREINPSLSVIALHSDPALLHYDRLYIATDPVAFEALCRGLRPSRSEREQSIETQLRVLQRTSALLDEADNVNTMLCRTVELARDLLNPTTPEAGSYYSHIAVVEGSRLVFDPEHNTDEVFALLAAELGQDAAIDLNSECENGIGISGQVALTQQAVLVPDVRTNPDYRPLKGAGGGQISVPIFVEDTLFAVLSVEHPIIGALGELHLDTLKVLAQQVGEIITSKERYRALQALVAASQVVTTPTSVRAVLQTIAVQAFTIANSRVRQAGECFVHVGMKEGHTLRYVAAYPERVLTRFAEEAFDVIDLRKADQPKMIGVSGRAVVSGATQNVADVSVDRDYLEVNLDPTRKERTINSQLAVPIAFEGRVIGVISIDHPAYAAFSREDVLIIELLSRMAAIAIQNSLRNEKLERTIRSLQAATEITSEDDYNHVLQQTVRQAQRFLSHDETSVRSRLDVISHIAVREYNRLRFKPQHNIPQVYDMLYEMFDGRPVIDLDDGEDVGVVSQVAKTGQLANIPDVSVNDLYLDARGNNTGSQLSVPIKRNELVVAVLSVEHPDTDYFDDQDERTLLALAYHVETVLRNIESQSALRAVTSIGDALLTLGLDTILQNIADEIYEMMSAVAQEQGVFVHISLRQGRDLRYVAAYPRETINRFIEMGYGSYDLEERQAKGLRLGIAGRAAVTGIRQSVPDVTQDPDYLEVNLDRQQAERTINSQLAVPIKLKDEVLGVISIDHPDFGAFSEVIEDRVDALANLASIAIHNSRQLAQRFDKDTLRGIAHDLKSPLTSIQYILENIRDGIYDHSTEIRNSQVAVAMERVRFQEQLISDLLARITMTDERIGLNYQLIDFFAAVESAVARMRLDAQRAGVRIVIEGSGPLQVYADPNIMNSVLDNLLSNAIKYSGDGSDKKVLVRLVRRGDQALLTVRDNGIGIAEDDIGKIFDAGYRANHDAVQRLSGHGQGLHVTQKHVVMHRGRIQAASNGLGQGTTFQISIPLDGRKEPM